MDKRKVKSEEDLSHMMLPMANDVIGIAKKLLGFDRVLVNCKDCKEHLCQIRGKMKIRTWVRLGDTVLVSPCGFQSDKRGDIIWRYKGNRAEWPRRNG